VLESASYLRLSLVCARGTPVADMLAHSAPLPLIIDHFNIDYEIAAEDEEGITLALQHRDRARSIRLRGDESTLQKFINSFDGEFPILEYLLIVPLWKALLAPWSLGQSMNFPETFRAPHLRHLSLTSFHISIESPLLATMAGLVTLSLNSIPGSAYFDPNALLQRVSLMPQLKILEIHFDNEVPTHIRRQLLHAPIMARVALPNLLCFGFKGDSAYLEALLPLVALPLLEKLKVYFFYQLTHSIHHLQQFMGTAENFWPNTITLAFKFRCVEMMVYPHEGAREYTLSLSLGARSIDQQVASAIQVFQTLRISSTVENLTLKHDGRTSISWLLQVGPDRTKWRELLRLFVNVKTLFIEDLLVGYLSRALQPGTGESPTELLPELQELSFPVISHMADAFTPFIDAREKSGRPVTMIHH
jgi:hypothetical protein